MRTEYSLLLLAFLNIDFIEGGNNVKLYKLLGFTNILERLIY